MSTERHLQTLRRLVDQATDGDAHAASGVSGYIGMLMCTKTTPAYVWARLGRLLLEIMEEDLSMAGVLDTGVEEAAAALETVPVDMVAGQVTEVLDAVYSLSRKLLATAEEREADIELLARVTLSLLDSRPFGADWLQYWEFEPPTPIDGQAAGPELVHRYELDKLRGSLAYLGNNLFYFGAQQLVLRKRGQLRMLMLLIHGLRYVLERSELPELPPKGS
jgi:hypothetical protein